MTDNRTNSGSEIFPEPTSPSTHSAPTYPETNLSPKDTENPPAEPIRTEPYPRATEDPYAEPEENSAVATKQNEDDHGYVPDPLTTAQDREEEDQPDMEDLEATDEDSDTTESDQTESGEEEEKRRRLPWWVEYPLLVVLALTIAVLIKTFLFQPFYIPSESMLPTIEVNDRVIVSKVNYRFTEPARGEVVVFTNPYAGPPEDKAFVEAVFSNVLESIGIQTDSAEDFIKRVVALEGEQFQILDNQILIDGVPLEEDYLPVGVRMPDFPPNRRPIVIPDNNVFVMGDNRNYSSDSRVFGPIPTDTIVGEAVLRVWPLSRIGGL